MGRRLVVPACRRHPGRRNTGLRTAPTAYRGWKLPRLWSSSPLWRSSSDGIPSLVQRIYLIYCKKCAMHHVTRTRSVRISASGGDDDRRRAFPPPRRWWQPCVTPYFATRGRGDMRGVPNRSCTQSHPGGGAGLCFRRGFTCITLCVNGVKHSRVVQ